VSCDRDDEIARLKSKVGEITMDNELLYALNGKSLRAIPVNARHHSSCGILRLRFNLPQPGVSIIRAAPHSAALMPTAGGIPQSADGRLQSAQ
jgi:hypothetical protein